MPNRDARAIAEDRFETVAAHFAKVYGMRLPRHVIYAAAFFLGLDAKERSRTDAFDAQSLLGIGQWFLDGWFEGGVLQKKAWADERCHGRFRRDPPEMITFVSGASDASHWGLWYDDPRELPRVCAHNWARDSAETVACEPTLLASILARFDRVDDEEATRGTGPIADWMRDLVSYERSAHRAEAIGAPLDRPDHCIGGMAPAGVAIPSDLLGVQAERAREEAYRKHPDRVQALIAQAREELAKNEPGRALFVGRELHWLDDGAHAAACTELLVGAYRALGRDALADVVVAHHGARDMRSVDAYAERSSPLQLAAEAGDVAALRRLLGAGRLERSRLEAAVNGAANAEVRDLLIAHDPRALDIAVARALLRASPTWMAEKHEAAAVLRASREAGESREALMTRLTAERAFRMRGVIAQYGDSLDADVWNAEAMDLVARSIAKHRRLEPVIAPLVLYGHLALAHDLLARRDLRAVDVAWTDADGATLLHAAASAPSAEIAAILIARGASRDAKDAKGNTPLDRAKQATKGPARDEANKVIALLEPRTSAAPEAAPAGPREPGPGDRVKHAKFGEGTIVSSDAGKLTIRFADATRTLLARFVERI